MLVTHQYDGWTQVGMRYFHFGFRRTVPVKDAGYYWWGFTVGPFTLAWVSPGYAALTIRVRGWHTLYYLPYSTWLISPRWQNYLKTYRRVFWL